MYAIGNIHVRVIRQAKAHLPLPLANCGVLRVAPASNVNLVMSRVKEEVGQEAGELREDGLDGVVCGVLGGVEGGAGGAVGAGQGGAEVGVTAAPAVRVAWCVDFKHDSDAAVPSVFNEGNYIVVAVALKLAVAAPKCYIFH